MRLSAAKKIDTTKTKAAEAYNNFVPGCGLKFFVDGLPSVNLVCMYGVNGIPSWNFFGRDISTHIVEPETIVLELVATKFSTATTSV